MRSTAVRSMARRWQRSIVPGGAIVLSMMLAHCGGGGGGGSGDDCNNGSGQDQCDTPGAPCPALDGFAEVCFEEEGGCDLACVNVCDRPGDLDDNSVALGDRCEFDADCEGTATCDNDVIGINADCLCVNTPTCTTTLNVAYSNRNLPSSCTAARQVKEIGGTPGRWELKRTCRRTNGACTLDIDQIGLGRDYTDNTDVCWVDDAYKKASGTMCGSAFSFSEIQANGEYETGVFHFLSSTDFNAEWTIYNQLNGYVVARCKGKGRAASAGSPDAPPDCNEYNPFGD